MGTSPNQPTASAANMGTSPNQPTASAANMGTSPNQPTQNVFQSAAQATQQAGQTYGNLANFQAPTASAANMGSAASIAQGPTMAQTSMTPYMNPYTQNVINNTQQDIMRQQQMSQNQLGAQATAAGAFGGSRHGVAQGTMAGEYGRMAGDIAAQQRQQAFMNAQQMAQGDISRQQQVAMQNAQMQQQAAMQNAQMQQQANLANQQAALSGAGIQATGAAGLGGVGQQAFGMGQATQQAIAGQGQLQRDIQQALIDASKMQYGQTTGAPLAGLGALSQILGNTPYGTTTTQSQSFNPASLLMML
jgi:hypothetical protein